MRITEAARYLGVSINTLKAMSDSGKIICHRTGGSQGQGQGQGQGGLVKN